MLSDKFVAFDFSYTLRGLSKPNISGIERIDRIYAHHFAWSRKAGGGAVVHSLPRPALLS